MLSLLGETLLDGELVAVRRVARSRPIILIHGNSSCKEAFHRLWEHLAAGDHHLIAVDLPGHGMACNAADPRTRYTLPGYAAAIRALLDRWDIRSCILFGWSLGGHIGMETMIDDDRVRGAFVVGSPPASAGHDVMQRAFSPDPRTLLAGKREFSTEDAIAYVAAMLGVDQPEQFFVDKAVRTDGYARQRLIESVAEGIGADEALAYADAARPLAVTVGSDDPFMNLDYFKSLDSRTMWGSQVHILPDEGHAPHFRPRSQFLALLNKFLHDTI